jgi:probable HAF family extracellular repeat protein
MSEMRTKRLLCGTALLCVMIAAGTGFGRAQELTEIDSGTDDSRANAVSANGAVVVGYSGVTETYGAVRFNDGGQAESLIDPSLLFSGYYAEATGVSDGGAVIVGYATFASGNVEAFRTTENGTESLGRLNGGSSSKAYDVSSDGSIVVGSAVDPTADYTTQAFIWTEDDGMTGLGTLDDGYNSEAFGISGDGSVIVGYSDNASYLPQAVYWNTSDGSITAIGLLPSGYDSYAYGASDDGSAIAGWGTGWAASVGAVVPRAFRWTEADGMVDLGSLGSGSSKAYDISGDGLVVVGTSSVTGSETGSRAFRWTDDTGMQSVEDWLRDNGATIVADITDTAFGTNCDGSVVVGQTVNNKAFIARAPSTNACLSMTTDSGGSAGGDGGSGGNGSGGNGSGGGGTGGGTGIVTVDDLTASLGSTAAANAATVQGINTTMNGLGSRPLDRRAPEGKAIFWASGDLGIDNGDRQDGSFGLGEIGLGYNFGPVQFNAAGGFDLIRQDTLLGGGSNVNTGFMKLEAFSKLYGTKTGGLWAVVTGVGMWGDADFHRNYLVNGGLVDTSTGNSGVAGYGVRGRLQWENALPHVSPYGEISYAHSCVDGYVEQGGAFPAAFNKLCDGATEARIGFDATVPVNETFRLTGTVEGVHRFESSGSAVSGQVIGIGSFSFAQPDYEQTWLRAGIGFEADIAGSTLSVMVNGTTSGEAPDGWIAMSWRKTF